MLVLSRYEHERFYIETPDGHLLSVVVVECRHHKVKIGIEAGPEFRIEREEVRAARLAEEKGEQP